MENNLNNTMGQVPPKNYLIEAIIATFVCCLPLGIVTIINATKVNSLWAVGDVEGANKASQEAQKWLKYAVIAGLAQWAIVIIFMVIGIIAS